jgi:CheY-like chemotaxis protein
VLEGEGVRVDTVARADTLARRFDTSGANRGGTYDSALIDLPFATSVDPKTLPGIVLLSPRDRAQLPDLTARGYAGYLIKPIRTQSLLARLGVTVRENGTAAETARSDTPPTPKRNVLIAEDNDLNAMLTEALLARLGHAVTRVRDGAGAIEKVRAARKRGTPFDLVLMDIHMPGLDGLSATREIRKVESRDPHSRRVAIVALTANAFAEDRTACLDAGMDMFLTKPVDRDALADCLGRIPPKQAKPSPGSSATSGTGSRARKNIRQA